MKDSKDKENQKGVAETEDFFKRKQIGNEARLDQPNN